MIHSKAHKQKLVSRDRETEVCGEKMLKVAEYSKEGKELTITVPV